MELAGGYRKGDRASCNGKPCIVVGPPGVKTAAKFSIAVRFDDGHTRDVRASTLSEGGASSLATTPPEINVKPAEFQFAPQQRPTRPTANFDLRPKVRTSTGKGRLIPPTMGRDAYAWECQSRPIKRMTEDIPAPEGYVSGGYPTQNFIKAVIDKDPAVNDHDAPDTQTICSVKGKYHKALPDDPKERQKELVRIYTLETQIYPQMNLGLRQDNFQRMKYFGAFIKELREVFYTDGVDQIIEPYVGASYRGITVPNPGQFIQTYVPGYEFVWTSFTSTTANKEMACGFGNLLFEIHCREPPTGSFDDEFPEYAPADIRMFSDSKEETEILIPPNTRLRVITVQMPTRTNGLSVPMISCETVGYDSVWGLIDQGNWGEVKSFLTQHYHLCQSDGYTHSIVHAAIDSGDIDLAEAVLEAEPNFEQECAETGLDLYQKLSVRFPALSQRIENKSKRIESINPQEKAPPAYRYEQERFSPTAAPERPATVTLLSDSGRASGTASLKGEDFTRDELAGGFVKGDSVVTNDGAFGVVMGPPGKKALKGISVTVQYDNGAMQDVRVNKLRLCQN